MAIWSTGSVADHVGAILGWTSVPSSISGTTLSDMISQEINFVEQFTSDTISDNSIIEKYQPAIIDLTLSKVLIAIESQEGGVDNVRLGDLSVSSGKGGNSELAIQLREDAIRRLKELQRTVRFKRVIGC